MSLAELAPQIVVALVIVAATVGLLRELRKLSGGVTAADFARLDERVGAVREDVAAIRAMVETLAEQQSQLELKLAKPLRSVTSGQ